MTRVSKLIRRIRRFAAARRGNVAMIFALSLVPLSLAAGASLDYARAIVVRAAMAEALDAAALAVGSTPGLTQAQMQTMAQQYFDANYHENASYGTPTKVQITGEGQHLVVSTTDAMPTTILKAVGITTMNVNVASNVVWGQLKIWVSLVLDNTGSMCQSDTNPNAGSPCPTPAAGSKIAALKTATHSLLSMLQSAATNAGDVKVSIIPFVKDVNVGTGNVSVSWLDWTSWDSANGSCSISGKTSRSACEGTHGTWSGGSCNITTITSPTTCIATYGTWTAAHCSKSSYTTQTTCTSKGYTWTAAACNISGITTQATCTSTLATWTGGSCNLSGFGTVATCTAGVAVWTPSNHSTWGGCITDRGSDSGPDATYNYDVSNASPVSGRATSYFPPEQYSSCPQSLLPLTYDWSALSNKVDAMVASGSTNQTIGLVWGWHAMSYGQPLSAGSPPDGTARYIIILSDGLNTQDRWYGNGSTQSSQVDSRMALVCANAKADGIIIFSVFVDIGGTQGNSTVLQNCASDSSKYFDLTSAGQITAAFNTIGQQITNLHLSQ